MSGVLGLTPAAPPIQCRRCGTGLAPAALVCPACAALVHRERLEALAADADTAMAAHDRDAARALWQQAQVLVPPGSEQHRAIADRIASLATASVSEPQSPNPSSKWTRSARGAAAAAGLLILSKLKLLLLGLTKLSTLLSMFGFIGVYWTLYGWPLAFGLAGSIYIHEMGHVAMLRRLGIRADAPLFIPGVGAMVMLREHVTDPIADARIGLAGPVWGLSAGVASWLVYMWTDMPTWRAIAELTGFLNLFNLIPIWQLDGARGFQALSANERWLVVAMCTLSVGMSGVGVLWIVAAVGAYRAFRHAPGPGSPSTLVTFAVLISALSWLARGLS